MAKDIEEYLKERYAEKLVSMREADEMMRPITAFARGHMTHTQSLLARWPDLETDEEKSEAALAWFHMIEKRIEAELDKWFQGDRAQILVDEYVAACFREAITAFLGNDARSNAPQVKLARERLNGRAAEIAKILAGNAHSLRVSNRVSEIIILWIQSWGQHGAHFPDT